ncbi:NapC/NirT family cytochrome c [Varunaivibrio sulfuroxidans]|uniref:Cytochrome c-type protein n=1 Tax=Varunaivibrio sulfuroxidans TaxID=1773489 RepID=A0A4R3JDN1_9PROT|nr:NapC/NirT family cytochrome c [Varunaivibrio sulfuroxidans]TCS63525.1 cytochrome c-type protein NapC [Varunaivibrio sulfuroxidans]WES30330.1 NapC/NirT family cytochrome c [Varunaivibrio sulfuroxidans]
MFSRLWKWFFSPTSRYGWGLILVIGGVGGAFALGGFDTLMEQTNTIGFCVSCHEMSQTVYPEYKKSPHYKNAAGVRAKCSDCHVPKQWWPKVIRKIEASNEVFHKLTGTIDTPQKFEAKRLELAKIVWATMKSNDSRACRSCHSFKSMDFHKQNRRAARKMEAAMKEGKTCIDCHKGIAHHLPKGYKDDQG